MVDLLPDAWSYEQEKKTREHSEYTSDLEQYKEKLELLKESIWWQKNTEYLSTVIENNLQGLEQLIDLEQSDTTLDTQWLKQQLDNLLLEIQRRKETSGAEQEEIALLQTLAGELLALLADVGRQKSEWYVSNELIPSMQSFYGNMWPLWKVVDYLVKKAEA